MNWKRATYQTFNPQPKPEKVVKIKKPLDKTRKVTGEAELFKEIASKRKRVSFISGAKIDPVYHYNCAHVLPKKNYEAFRLYEKNIVLLTQVEHELWDQGRHKIKDNPAWKKMFDLEADLKEEYKNQH